MHRLPEAQSTRSKSKDKWLEEDVNRQPILYPKGGYINQVAHFYCCKPAGQVQKGDHYRQVSATTKKLRALVVAYGYVE